MNELSYGDPADGVPGIVDQGSGQYCNVEEGHLLTSMKSVRTAPVVRTEYILLAALEPQGSIYG